MKTISNQVFLVCLLLSLFLHLAILGGSGWRPGSLSEERALLLEANLLTRASAIPSPAGALEDSEPPQLPAKAYQKTQKTRVAPSPQNLQSQISQHEQSLPETTKSTAVISSILHSEIAPPPPDTVPPLPRNGRIVFSRRQGIDGPVIGRLTHEWQHDDTSYTLRSISESTGLIGLFGASRLSQSSEGSFNKGELKPTRFTEEQDGKTRTAQFDWSYKQVISDRSSATIPDTAQDDLTVFYQLMRILQRGEGSLAIVDSRGLNYYGVILLSEDTLQYGFKPLRTWHLRLGTGGPGTTEVWLAQENGGLPIRIRRTDADGKLFEWLADEFHADVSPSLGGG